VPTEDGALVMVSGSTGQTVVPTVMISVVTVVLSAGHLVTVGGHLVMVLVVVLRMVLVVHLVGLWGWVGSTVGLLLDGVVDEGGLLLDGLVDEGGLLLDGVVDEGGGVWLLDGGVVDDTYVMHEQAELMALTSLSQLLKLSGMGTSFPVRNLGHHSSASSAKRGSIRFR